jgi:very-short-patch-repair endonuclease
MNRLSGPGASDRSARWIPSCDLPHPRPHGSSARDAPHAYARQSAEATIVALAARQHGVVTRSQLLAAGISPATLTGRLKTHRLRPLHRGVYLVGPLLPPYAPYQAAVMACGVDAVVSHRSAATLWSVLPAEPGGTLVDITVRRTNHRRPGVRLHRRALGAADVTTVEGIPVTTPVRTLFDIAGWTGGRDLERAVAHAVKNRLASGDALRALVTQHPRSRGVGRLRKLLGSGGPAFTRSEAEECFLELVRRAQLSRPAVNATIAGFEVDFLWAAARLIVEVDGFAFHSSRRIFERDRRRDAVLTAQGFRVIRITWRQLKTEREAVIVRVAQALAR